MPATQLSVEARTRRLDNDPARQADGARFEGIAVTAGTYEAQGGIEVRVREDQLSLVAERLVDTQIRDLHEDRIEATVGAVTDARLKGEKVVFEGEVGIEPHATIVRRFPETVRFSVGFRFSADDLEPDARGVADLPEDFVIDHIAIVGQGQDPNARLTKLLNRARPGHSQDGMHMEEDTIAELRRQRDEALEAEKSTKADLAKTESRLETTNEKLDEAEQAVHEAQQRAEQAEADAEAARLELERAKSGFATSIIKLELKAGEDVDLRQRQDQLMELDLAELDELRLELAEQAADQADPDTGPASRPAGNEPTANPSASTGSGMDLEELSMEDTLRLGLVKGAI